MAVAALMAGFPKARAFVELKRASLVHHGRQHCVERSLAALAGVTLLAGAKIEVRSTLAGALRPPASSPASKLCEMRSSRREGDQACAVSRCS